MKVIGSKGVHKEAGCQAQNDDKPGFIGGLLPGKAHQSARERAAEVAPQLK